MFSLRPRPKAPPTFKTRVTQFWEWFAKNATRLYDTIEAQRCGDLQPETSEQLDRIYSGAAWCFGPGENREGHSLTFTAEGDRYRQLLTAYWLQHAPKLPGWTFYAAKQRDPNFTGKKIHFNELKFDPNEFWLTPYVDEHHEVIDITAWHPKFPQMEERARWTSLFLFLDEALGELGTQNWIGEIKLSEAQLADSLPMTELPSFVDSTVTKHNWKLERPGESWCTYETEERSDHAFRADIVTGSTCLFSVVQDVVDGHLEEDPFEGTGAALVYVVLPRSVLTPGKEVDSRGEFEDAIAAELAPDSGKILGGSIGYDHAYIDLLLFDGKDSLEIVKKALRSKGLGRGTSIEFFAKSRKSERIRL